MRTQHLTTGTRLGLGQIRATLGAILRPSGVAGTAKGTVHIRTSLGASHLGRIGDQLLLRCLLELYVVRLGRTAISTTLLRAWVL